MRNDAVVERIRTALAFGNFAEARAIRTEAFRDIIREAHDSAEDPDYDGWNGNCVDLELMETLDNLGIPEEK